MTVLIRLEAPQDYPSVFDVNRRAFDSEIEARLVDALRPIAQPYVSLVAVREGEVIGHVFFSPVAIEAAPPSLQCFGLGPMAVVPELQRLIRLRR